MATTKAMTHEDAVRVLRRRGVETVGYAGLGHTGWHRFTTMRGTTLDVRRNPRTGKMETR
jgi:hypothetical protein